MFRRYPALQINQVSAKALLYLLVAVKSNVDLLLWQRAWVCFNWWVIKFVAAEVRNAFLKFPVIYLMDCTFNDCGLILKSVLQVWLISNWNCYFGIGMLCYVCTPTNYKVYHSKVIFRVIISCFISWTFLFLLNSKQEALLPPFRNSWCF